MWLRSSLLSCLALAFLFSSTAAHATPITYLVTVKDAIIAPVKANKRRWDGGFGKMTLPDVYVVLEIGGKRFQTLTLKDTLQPAWKASFTIQAKPTERLYIRVLDADLTKSEVIGEADALIEKIPPKMMFGQVIALHLTVEKLSPPTPPPAKREDAPPAKRAETPVPPVKREDAPPAKREDAPPAKRTETPAPPTKREDAPPASRPATPNKAS